MLLKSPIDVFWSVTNQCNLECNFCLADSCKNIPKDELTSSEREFVLNEIIKNNVLKVYLTGGEPLVCPDILYYVEQLRKKNIFVELTTNGTLLTKSIVRKLKEFDTNRIQISLNGSNPSINDPLMGVSFEKIMSKLKLLLDAEVNTHVKVTVVKDNLEDIPILIRMLANTGIEHIDVSEVHPLGRAFKIWSQLKVEPRELFDLREKIIELQNETGQSLAFHSSTIHMVEEGLPASCTIGDKHAYTCQILPNGNVIPCAFASVWNINNNILNGGLAENWKKLKKYKQYRNPTKLKGHCGNCELKYTCVGGCRAVAYLFSGTIWGEYPFCPVKNQEYRYEFEKEMANTNL